VQLFFHRSNVSNISSICLSLSVFLRTNVAEKPIAVTMAVIAVVITTKKQVPQPLHLPQVIHVMLATQTWHQSKF
jgi:hypothetical protein